MKNLPSYKPVINWRNETNKSKLYSIHLRINLQGTQRYYRIEVPLKVRLDQWSDKEGVWVKNTHPFAFEINDRIRETINIVTALVQRHYSAQKNLTFPIIFKELQKSNNHNSFNEYFDDRIKDPPEDLNITTMERYRVCLGHLNNFQPLITFNELDDSLVQKFKKYLSKDQGLAGSTVNGYFNALKKVVHWARKDHHITKDHEETIFENLVITIGKAKKDHLEVQEILEWQNLIFPENKTELERDRDMFLLLIYTGYYYSDLKKLEKSDLKNDYDYGQYLYSDRFKNENLAIVPLWKFPAAYSLIKSYTNRIKDPGHPNYKYLLDRGCFIEDQAFNRNLKVIAHRMLKWKRNVYNKLGRTTNSQIYIRFGANRPIVSKMLGHEKEETTSHYFDVNIREIIEGVKNVDFARLGIGQKIA